MTKYLLSSFYDRGNIDMNIHELNTLLSQLTTQERQQRIELLRMMNASSESLALGKTQQEIKEAQYTEFCSLFEVREVIQLDINGCEELLRHVVVPKKSSYLNYIQRVEFPFTNRVY